MQLNLMNLFDGYVRNYHTFNLTIHHGKHSFTMTEIEYFSRLGSMLGYFSYTEDTCDQTYRPMDLTWWGDYREDYYHDFILHLERENYFNKDEETLEKLFAKREYTPNNAIGIMNVRNKNRISDSVNITNKTAKIPNSLLVFRTNSDDNKQSFFNEIHAYLFNKNQLIATKVSHVKSIGGTLYMYYENEV